MIDYDEVDLINDPVDPVDSKEYSIPDFDNMQSDVGSPNFTGSRQVGNTSLGDSQYDNDTPFDAIGNLDTQRSEEQSVYAQAGNAVGQMVVGEIIGGTIEGLGYLLDIGSVIDVMQGDEADWGNFMTDLGQGIREGSQENMKIYSDPDATGFGKMGDSGWWFSNGVSVASTLSMLIPTMGAMKALSFLGKGVRASKGMAATRKAVGLAEKMGTKGKWMQKGISQAILSRNIENWMEAHGTYEDYKSSRAGEINPETKKEFTEDELNTLASDAASNNWKNGWAMLLQDIPQYLAIGKVFNPISKKMESALGAASKKGVKAGMNLISERAKYLSDLDAGLITEKQYSEKIKEAFGSEEMLTSAFFGGLGGNVFKAAGKGLESAFTSKSDKEYQERLGKYYSETIKNDASQVSLMYQHLAQ